MPEQEELLNEQIKRAVKTGNPLKYLKKHSIIDKLFERALEDINPLEYLESKGIDNDNLKDFIFREENKEIRDKVFSKIFNFSGTNIIDSMRLLTSAFPLFRMEANPLGRALESFSMVYAQQHGLDPDKCELLANTILMLQTSLHNPNIKDKDRMDLTKYINLVTTAGIDIVSKKEIEDIYNSVESMPLGSVEMSMSISSDITHKEIASLFSTSPDFKVSYDKKSGALAIQDFDDQHLVDIKFDSPSKASIRAYSATGLTSIKNIIDTLIKKFSFKFNHFSSPVHNEIGTMRALHDGGFHVPKSSHMAILGKLDITPTRVRRTKSNSAEATLKQDREKLIKGIESLKRTLYDVSGVRVWNILKNVQDVEFINESLHEQSFDMRDDFSDAMALIKKVDEALKYGRSSSALEVGELLEKCESLQSKVSEHIDIVMQEITSSEEQDVDYLRPNDGFNI